jgi:hypothetical protein
MDRYARRQHFERLCRLRDEYARRGAADSVAVISIEDVIAWVADELEGDDVARFVAEETHSDNA